MFKQYGIAVALWILACPAAAITLPSAYTLKGPVRTESVPLTKLTAGKAWSLLYSVPSLEGDARIQVRVEAGAGRLLASKTLHVGDTDFYVMLSPASGDKPELRVEASAGLNTQFTLVANAWPDSNRLKRGPSHAWQQANQMDLGQTIFASGDEKSYIPVAGTTRAADATDVNGDDWYRFVFSGTPKLVYFQLELMDRDDLPADVSVFREQSGKMVEFLEGQDPPSAPHEVQALPGNKFTPRLLKDGGVYYVRVRANHPEYKLRTRLYNAPPYQDPKEAVRAAIDYLMGAGDSWFANTPRRGGTLDRVMPVHQETSLCVGCHAAHFPQRAQLYATAQGYPVTQRQQLQFLQERFYNNPRPFYGFEDQGAVWTRVISAPANVLSRISLLTSMFEDNVSRIPRPETHQRIAKYLEIYYKGLDKLPPDETNGNTPLVSTFEIGWYSWKANHDARLPEMIAAAPVKNMVDLCYQTLALADMDKVKYGELIQKNAERILSLQRPGGQWSMRFEPNQVEVEFQTGHALWALQAAGIPATNPQVKQSLDFLMARQQTFGGWMDPKQSFENFKTPFRETQMAVLALSAYFPNGVRAKGWNSAVLEHLSADPLELLDQLDNVWDRPSAAVLREIQGNTSSNDALLRQAAAEALGRLALPETAGTLVALLGDPSKMAQRTAAWSLRQIYSNRPGMPSAPVVAALGSKDDRTRWGAGRIFAHHFSELARRPEFIAPLAKLASDPSLTLRMEGVRALWQAWFWNADVAVRGTIEETILARLGEKQHPWVEANLRAAVYNLADENIRYLYNNWVTLLPRPEDRQKAIQGRLAIEGRLSARFTKILATSTAFQKKQLLNALVEPVQRRGDIYDVEASLTAPVPPVYNRIGNDIEQIAFFGEAAGAFSKALQPLLDSPDAEMKTLAARAALLVRETPYAETEKVAGGRTESSRDVGKKVSAMPEAAAVSNAFYYRATPPGPPRRVNAATAAVAAKLDETYFRENIEPILQKKGPDGYACVNCHSTHTLFNATWSTIANVIDGKDPENSLLLKKPTSTAESEGVVGAATTAHGGGQRWTTLSSEYSTILKWIEGAK
jgi:hypothetical protein